MTLKYDNGEGLIFRRTIAIDDRFLFTVKDEVNNNGSAPVTLYPFALISRHGTPQVAGFYILHEGLIGYLGEQGLQEIGYKTIADAKPGQCGRGFDSTSPMAGSASPTNTGRRRCCPTPRHACKARFSLEPRRRTKVRYQTDYLLDPQTIATGGTGSANARLFAGAKEAASSASTSRSRPRGYNKQLELNHFDLLIDWGWFYFITKPMFWRSTISSTWSAISASRSCWSPCWSSSCSSRSPTSPTPRWRR